MAPMLDTGCSILDFLIQNPESSIEYLGTRALGLRHHQPARKLVLELACEINTELRACIQTQRVAVCAIEQQSDRAATRRAERILRTSRNSSPVVAAENCKSTA